MIKNSDIFVEHWKKIRKTNFCVKKKIWKIVGKMFFFIVFQNFIKNNQKLNKIKQKIPPKKSSGNVQ